MRDVEALFGFDSANNAMKPIVSLAGHSGLCRALNETAWGR